MSCHGVACRISGGIEEGALRQDDARNGIQLFEAARTNDVSVGHVTIDRDRKSDCYVALHPCVGEILRIVVSAIPIF